MLVLLFALLGEFFGIFAKGPNSWKLPQSKEKSESQVRGLPSSERVRRGSGGPNPRCYVEGVRCVEHAYEVAKCRASAGSEDRVLVH